MSQSPFGYDRKRGKLVKNVDELRVLDRIKEWWAEGLSNDRIAEELNFAGMPTKRKNGLWYGATVGDILIRLRRDNEF